MVCRNKPLRAENITYNGFTTSFKVFYKDEELGDIDYTCRYSQRGEMHLQHVGLQ